MTIYVNGEPRETSPGATLADLLRELGLERKAVAVELNLHVAPRAEHARRALSAGDRLEIVSLVGGG